MLARPGVVTNMDAAEEQIIWFRDHLDCFIEMAAPPIRLTRDQHVIARCAGRSSDIKVVQSRGAGKTFLTALICWAICSLYPGTIVAVCSGTAAQATLVLQKLKMLADQNENIARELVAVSQKNLVTLSKDKGKCTFKNGSVMESFSIESMRGLRAKIVVIDECPEVDQESQDAIVSPIKNYSRDISFNYGFQDFRSKTISITSACEKSNSFYGDFVRVVKMMHNKDREGFACALDYRAAAANGITDMSFFEAERARMPELIFAMEYGSKFIGADNNTVYPFDLTQQCRTLKKVELEQPKNSSSFYVMGVDIATSRASGSDNSSISIIKYTEKSNGSFAKKLVSLRTFNGKTLDLLAEEVRNIYHTKFPNIVKIVYDARGLGDSFDRFFDKEWVDIATGKEYPPLVVDDIVNTNPFAVNVLHPFRAVQGLNQRMYTNMRVALEQKTFELPISYRAMKSSESEKDEGAKELTMQEKAVFQETDALQYEMGNIVAKVGASGNVLFDTTSNSYHKDRVSSTAMALDYICELEKENIARHKRADTVIGFASEF